MRCEDLTRELASPTGTLSRAEMAGHIADCPACAEWSRRADRFDRAWEATRPLEPSALAMDSLWANASAALDERWVAAPAGLRFKAPARRRRWTKAAFVLAQAAAVLVAALFLLRRDGVKPVELAGLQTPSRTTTAPPVPVTLTVGLDQTAIVRIGEDDGGHRVEIHEEASPSSMSSTIPEGTQRDFFNDVEIMASSILDRVASR